MANPNWRTAASRLRRLLTVSAIATSNVHKCFNGLEPFMLAPPELWRGSRYKCFNELDYDELDYNSSDYESDDESDSETVPQSRTTGLVKPASIAIADGEPTGEDSEQAVLEADDAIQLESDTTSYYGTNDVPEEYHDDPIDSQFGPLGSSDYLYVSKHMGGPLPQLVMEEPSYFYILTTYLSYMILTWIGHIRDFFGKRFKPEKYNRFREHDGYAAVNSDWENFYFRRLKTRMNDCFSRPITGVPGRYITLMDRGSHDYNQTFYLTGTHTETLNLSSYNYLGFAQSSGPCADDVQIAITEYGISTVSPRLDAGTTDLTVEVEREVAKFVGREDAMIFSMGFSTNATSFPALVSPGCLILSDELNHASIRVGARLSGAVIRSYKHNDMEHLEKMLREAISQGQPRTRKAWKKILVVCEGLFSMEGNIVDLPNICRLRKIYKFYLFVDEAHSIGALGPRGRGVCDYFNIDPSEVDILMGTFTKSFGANGGYVAADKATIQALRATNAAMHYGESPTPPVLMQILSSLHQIASTAVGLERLQRITFNSRYLRLGLKRLGFIIYGHDDSPVVPLMIYHPGKLPAFSREMLKRGISIVIAGYPATPLLTARARLCVSAAHNKDDMDRVLKACDEIGDLLDLKFSTGMMGGIHPQPEGNTLANTLDQTLGKAGKVVAPRWKLEDVLSHGVQDARCQLK